MLIYDESNSNPYTIETNDINYIYRRTQATSMAGGKIEWRLLFVLGKSSVEWGYATKELQTKALENLHKLLKAKSINFLEL